MHGYNSGSAVIVNAEVDSMGGVVDGGVGIGLKISPHRVAIEKAQAELREEYDVREERRRELEFLEKGGNPLDFKSGNAVSASVQSTSLADQYHEQFVTSERKDSFALAASPHGDSVDSSARPGAPSVNEPNTADNLLLFDGENELPESEKRCLHSNTRNAIAPSEQSSQIDGSQNAKETEDSAIFRPYTRRNRSRPNHGPRGASREGMGLISETNNQKDHNIPSVSKPKPTSLNGDIVTKNLSTNTLNNELVGIRDHQSTSGSASVPEDKLDIILNRNLKESHETLRSQHEIVQNPDLMAFGEANVVEVREPVAPVNHEPPPHVVTIKPENGTYYGQPNGFDNVEVDRKSVPNECQNSIAVLGLKNFYSEPSRTQTSLGRDVNNDSDICTNTKKVDANGNTMQQTFALEKKLNFAGCEVVKDRNKTISANGTTVSNEHDAGYQNHSGSGDIVKAEEDINLNSSCMSNIEGVHQNDSTISKADKYTVLLDHSKSVKENSCEKHQVSVDVSISEPPETAPAVKVTNATSDCQPCPAHHMKLADRAHEDSILEEARIIEAKRKRILELSICTLPTWNHIKAHWGFVLEEMAWLANDFAQERLWKVTAAAQLGHRAAFNCRLRFEKLDKHKGVKILAHRIAKAVMQFWDSAELRLDNDEPDISCVVESGKVDANEASEDQRRNSNVMQDTSKFLEGQNPIKHTALKVHAYALRFLKDSRSHGISSQAEAPATPDKNFDSGTVDMSWEEHLNEESLFYEVPHSGMETYRKSVEFHFLQYEKTGSSIQEELETSVYDTAAEFGSEENTYDEEEGETSAYYLPSDCSKSSKSVLKKHKNLKFYSGDARTDLPYVQYTTGTRPSMLFEKRPASLNVGSIPTKRMRTTTRHRVVSPFTVNTGTLQSQAKTDASSGDTNSFHDDQSTSHVGPLIQKSMEVESVTDFEKRLSYDCAETYIKTKKKKKAKILGSAYDQGWQLDSVLNEQKDHSKKRLDYHHFESYGSSGLYGQHNGKKPKIMKQSLDNALDNIASMTNSIPSPAASQMSNMPNPSKFIKIINVRDRGRKAKSLKVSAGQPGSGRPWSLFEDQALVVLVHDMGPNWELVSDAINSTLQIKCIFRNPKECKERHKFLMDGNAGDDADSAEDLGSPQSYPSTLPGIPKGSARQLFQRLQGPKEEDTLKSHFEKIINIGQKQHYLKNQIDKKDLKQLVPVHNSHVIALSQVCPNNLNGGLLTPLDLCDTNASNPDVLALGYQGSHAGGLALSNQGSVPSILPNTGVNSSLPGSSGMVLGNNLTSPSGTLSPSVRYGVPRNSPLSVEEQQRIQQYNQMLSGRNVQQSSMSLSGTLSGSDRGVRMLPGGNGMGLMGGISRSMAKCRPGLQGMASPSMLNSGSMHPSSMIGVPSTVNMQSGVGSGQGNSMLRPHEAIHMMRPGHNPDHQRQMMVPELQKQVTQGNSQGIPALSGMSSAFGNQTTPSPVQPYQGHTQLPHQLSQQQSHHSNPHSHLQGSNHATNSQQQAYAVRLAKERQMQQQQRYMQQQKQFAASNALMPHVQAQSQLPISSSPLQNSSQVQPQNSSQQGPLSPVTPSSPLTPMSSLHQQQKLHHPQHGFSRKPTASVLTNQAAKQRQRQPPQQQFQQPGRKHPNQQHSGQSQQHANLLKGIGRGGNMMVHQNLSGDPSLLNGLSTPLGSQTAEKGDQMMHMMQGQNIYPGSGLNPNQTSKPLSHVHSSNHSQLQQKLNSGSPTTSSKQLQIPSDTSAQGQVSQVSPGHMLSPPQPAVIASNHHQLQLQSQHPSKKINQNQSYVQRMLPKNRQVNSESPSKSQSDPTQDDQQPACSASLVSTSATMTQGCMDSTSMVPVVTTVSSQWKTSESPFDSNTNNQAPQVSSLGSAPVGNPTGNEPPTISQGLGPRSFSSTSHVHNSGMQLQQQQRQQPLQQSSSQPILSQQPYKAPEQHEQQQQEPEQHSPKDLTLEHKPQLHEKHLQSEQGSLFIQAPNSQVE
ncbi:chromatin modification-related protein EAF1 B-like isoform X2 [Gastrolobium bilobum]|uniref:chromatin modification-related protein EAF1 B-like isoform X2 n=1 Tax=Gastrolobium bilobum TaxID=150636 RepID=UPI002AB1BC94|nr:chromatin modification-related protein EAF1 B-like isoform X2 [Gastrolobium bilobum]